MPITRPGCDVAAEISVTDKDEVLVASTASGRTISSSCWKIAALQIQVLDNRLDHEIAVLEVGHRCRQRSAGRRC